MNLLPSNRYACDVIFIGHFENDGRDEAIFSLINSGYNVKVYGDVKSWRQSSLYYILNDNNRIEPIVDDYNLAINSAKIALNFLSKYNNDVYTRRCFEIPITGTVLVSEYSSFLEEVFENDNEIITFKNIDELKNKVDYLLNNPNELNRIGKNGMKKVKEKHSNFNRSLQILTLHESLK
jgi:spore maturation protein CgeB